MDTAAQRGEDEDAGAGSDLEPAVMRVLTEPNPAADLAAEASGPDELVARFDVLWEAIVDLGELGLTAARLDADTPLAQSLRQELHEVRALIDQSTLEVRLARHAAQAMA